MSEASRMVNMYARVQNPHHPRHGAKVHVVGTQGEACVCELLDSYSRNVVVHPSDLKQIEKKWEWVDVDG